MQQTKPLGSLLVLAICLALVLPPAVSCWGEDGHRFINRVAAERLPADVPAFFRNAGPRLSFLGPEPDRFGEVCLTFDMRAEVGGTGVGTFRDDVHPEVNSQFEINSARRHDDEFAFEGEIIASRSPDLVGKRITIQAESLGNGTGRASIIVGTNETNQPNLVVIAIIAVLIALLVPEVRKG